jgi:hypothetical protein
VVVRTIPTNHEDQTMSAATTNDYLANGTPVLNTSDGETGTIMNGFASDPARGWYEYEVATKYGIERWQRGDMLLRSEIDGNE